MEPFITKIEYLEDNIVKGHVEICSNNDNIDNSLFWISDLYVTETYRHIGNGTKLMNRTIDVFKKIGIPRIFLYCKPELISFYQKFGAEDAHQDMNGYNLMELNI